MHLLALGVNHRTAPVDLRERVAFTQQEMPEALRDFRIATGAREAALLSTCNRTELYCRLDVQDQQRAADWLHRWRGLDADRLSPFLYRHANENAVRHVYRVAAGLDSLVLGEPQILGQMKEAYQAARSANTLDTSLERLFQSAFQVAKQVRSETRVGHGSVSMASAAVQLARQIHGALDRATVLLLGAGEMGELTARHLREHGARRIIVANRTLERARQVAAPFAAIATGLDDLELHLPSADIVIASTSAQRLLLDRRQVERALLARRRQPMFLVDLGVPRNLDPEIGKLEDAYLFGVDDLSQVVEQNRGERQNAAVTAEQMVDVHTGRFMHWLQGLKAHDAVRRLRDHAHGQRQDLTSKALARLQAGEDPAAIIQHLSQALTNRLLHTPSAQLREAAGQGDIELIQMALRLHGVADDSVAEPDEST